LTQAFVFAIRLHSPHFAAMNRIGLGLGIGGAAAAGWYLSQPTKPKNMAFVFVKPHAVTPATNKTVKEGLLAKGLKITGEGDLKSDVIDKKKLIDQHYYSIASKATILKPSELNFPNDKFEKQFGISWEKAKPNAYNALDACEKLGISAEEISDLWAKCKKNDKLVKLGGGFYCGLVEPPGKQPIYVFNAFFMSMRNEFTKPGRSIHWYTVEWDEATLPWADFRGKVLGETDPSSSPPGSLRRKIYDDWKALGLPGQPNVGDNGVHASASPFEALCERMNWLEVRCNRDSYCRALTKAGVTEDTIKAWSVDPQVKLEGGKKGSIWDALEDKDCTPCLEKVKTLQGLQ